jgi:hypothetical protein
MKMIYLSTLICCVGLVASMTASAGFLDDFRKGFKNIEKTIREVEQVLGEPTHQAPTTPSRKTPTTSSEESSQNIDNSGSSSMSDIQLCESAANWLDAALREIKASDRNLNIYIGYDASELDAFRMWGVKERIRWAHDSFFIPAFGKAYDQMSDAEMKRILMLLAKANDEIKVGGKVRREATPCFMTITSKNPLIEKSIINNSSSLFNTVLRNRDNYNSAVSDMRAAPGKIEEYMKKLEQIDVASVHREEFAKLKTEIYPWLTLSLAGDRAKLLAKMGEIRGAYDNIEKKNKYASIIANEPVDSNVDEHVYTGSARFKLSPNNKTSQYFSSQVPLYSVTSGPGYKQMGIDISHKELTTGHYKDFEVLECQYGPFNGNAGGFTELHFWNTRRPKLSPGDVGSARSAQSASDIALPACPPTFGEAMAYTYGAKMPPSDDLIATEMKEAKAAGQRFAPKFATRTDFENTEFSLDGSSEVDDLTTIVIPYRVDKSTVPNVITSEIDRLNKSGHRLLQCRYKIKNLGVAVTNNTIHFWKDTKPTTLSESFGRWVSKLDVPMVDAVAKECPEYLGEAIALAQAVGTKEALAKAKDAAKRADADPIKPVKLRNDWYVGAKANSAQEDAQLAKELEREVSGLVGGSGLTWQGFNSTVKTRIAPKLLSLARSAYAQVDKLPAGERGRAAFEKWDELTAGTVMRSILRLERVIASNTTERMAFSDVMKNESQLAREKSERDGWQYNANIEFTQPIYYYFLPKYGDRFSKMSILDPSFIANVGKGLKSSTGSATNSTDLWKGGSQITFKETTTIVFGTPEEIAAWEFASDVGQNVGKAIVYWGQFKGSIQQLDQQIKESRAKFWQCYAKRCKDAARLYQDYSTVLYWKDMHYMVQPALLRKQAELAGDTNQTMQTLFKMGGAEEVDGGMPTSCSSEQSTFEAQVSTVFSDWKGGSLNTYKTKLDNAFKGPAYTNWQQCRDKMEYIMRPRNP